MAEVEFCFRLSANQAKSTRSLSALNAFHFMKHCTNCGFNNRDESIRCIKCNYVLEPVASDEKSNGYYLGGGTSPVQKTKAGIRVNSPAWDEKKEPDATSLTESCLSCGYPARTGEILCPNCGKPLAPETDANKTVRRVVPVVQTSASYRLVALSMDAETELKSIPLNGENIVLNRDLIDSGNNSISRTGHASLTYQGGEWWLENLSSLKSTFIQVNSPVKIKEGDVILIGDRLFRFKMD